MRIPALHIANLFAYGVYQRVSEPLLRTNLIKIDLDVCNPQSTVAKSEFLAVFEALIDTTQDPYLGLHYGCYLNIKALGLISILSLNASSIEQAVVFLQKYLEQSFPLVSLLVKEDREMYTLQLACSIEDEILKNHILDVVFCFLYRELTLMLREDFLPTLQLPYSEVDEYSNLLTPQIVKGKTHSILLNRSVLSSEINKKRVKEIELLLPQFMIMLESKVHKGFSLEMRNMILNMCCPEIPTFEQVSRQFPLSERTIQRKLKQEGQSFRKISDGIKKELSYYLTKGAQIKIKEIAYILGYSDPSAYLHAVKRWKTAV